MAANPRKFSEKIALHTQKQAEETAAFEKIMKEVMDATVTKPQPIPTSQQQNRQQVLLHPNPLGGTYGRCGSLPNVNTMSQHQEKNQQQSKMLFQQSPRSSRNMLGPGPVRVKPHRTDHSPYASPSSNTLSSSQTGNAGSPGGFSNYLAIPNPEPNWRRANSDSALNAINSLLIPSVVPDSSEESSNNSNDQREFGLIMAKSTTQHQQDSPNAVSGGSDGHSLLEIPQQVSTGSLPDLTNFQFQQPLPQSNLPPDQGDENQLNHSPYSNSPLPGSSLYSPGSLSPHGGSPGVLNHQVNHNSTQNQVQRHPQQQHQQQQQQQSQQQQSQLSRSPLSHQPILELQGTSFQSFTPNENMLTAYRCPQRPSPQSSPLPFRSPSPLEGHLSAPPSPIQSISQTTDDPFYHQQVPALGHHLAQIHVGDTSPQRNTHLWQDTGMVNSYYPAPSTGATAGVTTQQSPQHPQPQTPQTPSSIPDIILTEVLGSDFVDPIEAFWASEAANSLREGLGNLDGDAIEMLRDPTLVPLDSNAEDSFRLDRQHC